MSYNSPINLNCDVLLKTIKYYETFFVVKYFGRLVLKRGICEETSFDFEKMKGGQINVFLQSIVSFLPSSTIFDQRMSDFEWCFNFWLQMSFVKCMYNLCN